MTSLSTPRPRRAKSKTQRMPGLYWAVQAQDSSLDDTEDAPLTNTQEIAPTKASSPNVGRVSSPTDTVWVTELPLGDLGSSVRAKRPAEGSGEAPDPIVAATPQSVACSDESANPLAAPGSPADPTCASPGRVKSPTTVLNLDVSDLTFEEAAAEPPPLMASAATPAEPDELLIEAFAPEGDKVVEEACAPQKESGVELDSLEIFAEEEELAPVELSPVELAPVELEPIEPAPPVSAAPPPPIPRRVAQYTPTFGTDWFWRNGQVHVGTTEEADAADAPVEYDAPALSPKTGTFVRFAVAGALIVAAIAVFALFATVFSDPLPEEATFGTMSQSAASANITEGGFAAAASADAADKKRTKKRRRNRRARGR